MKVNFGQTVKLLDGNDAVSGEGEERQPLTLKVVCQNALLGQYAQENPDGAEKARRWLLAINLNSAPEVDVSAEEAALMKKLVGYAYGPLVVGQAYKMLDG